VRPLFAVAILTVGLLRATPLHAQRSADSEAPARAPEAAERSAERATMADDEPAPEVTQARALFDEGLALSGEGRLTEAAALFERSYALVPRASTSLNWAIVLERLGRPREALRSLDAFETQRASASDADRADADAMRERLGALLATLTLHVAPPEARVEVDGRPEPGEGPTRILALDPGEHVLRIAVEGHAAERRELLVSAGEELAEHVTLSEVELVVDPPTEPRTGLYVGIAIAGAAVLGIVVTILAIALGGSSVQTGTSGECLDPFATGGC